MQKLLCILFVSSSFSVFALTTEHDNNVCIMGGWDSVTFSTITEKDTDKYSVTPGQLFSGINPKNQPSEKNCQRVRSGRKNSATVMKWANDQNKIILGMGDDSVYEIPVPVPAKYYYPIGYIRPAEANFAVKVNMTLKKPGMELTCPNVIFGQTGHYKRSEDKNDLAPGNIWFVYATTTYGRGRIKCTNKYDGGTVVLQANHITQLTDVHTPVAMSVEDENDSNDEGSDEVSAFGSANSDNTIKLEIAV